MVNIQPTEFKSESNSNGDHSNLTNLDKDSEIFIDFKQILLFEAKLLT